MSYRDLNSSPDKKLAEIVKGLQGIGTQGATGAHGVKHMGLTGDSRWYRTDGSEYSVRDIDSDLADAQIRIDDAEASLADTQIRLEAAEGKVDGVREDLDNLDLSGAGSSSIVKDRAPLPEDGASLPAGAAWLHYDTSGSLVGMYHWDGEAWEPLPLDRELIPSVSIGTGTFGDLEGERLVVNDALSARIVQAMSAEVKKLVVTEEAILNHATLIGQTVVDDINVQGKLIGRDGVFTGTVDFENVNVTGTQIVNKLGAGSIEASMIKSGSFSGETFVGGTFSGARLDGGEFTLMGTPSKETTTYSQNFSSNAGGWVYYYKYNDKRSAYNASAGRSGGGLRYNGVEIYAPDWSFQGANFTLESTPDSGGFDVVRTVTAWVKASRALDGAYLAIYATLEAGSTTKFSSTPVPLSANTWKQLKLELPVGVKPRKIEARFQHGAKTGGLVPTTTATADIYLDDVEIKVPAGVASAAHLYVSSSGSPTFELASTSGSVLASLAAPVGGNARLQFPGSGGTVELSSAGLKNGSARLAVEPSRIYVEGDLTATGKIISLSHAAVERNFRVSGSTVTFDNLPTTSSAGNVRSQKGTGRLYVNTSSRRYKRNIVDWNPDAERVLSLRPRQWQHDDPNFSEDIDERWHVGFIAEEVDELGLKGLVDYAGDGKGGWRPESLNYDRFAAAHQVVLVDHESRIAALEARIEEMENTGHGD